MVAVLLNDCTNNIYMAAAKIYTYLMALKYFIHCVVGLGAGNPGMQAPSDDRRGPNRDFDERGGEKSILLVSELDPEVCIYVSVFYFLLILGN